MLLPHSTPRTDSNCVQSLNKIMDLPLQCAERADGSVDEDHGQRITKGCLHTLWQYVGATSLFTVFKATAVIFAVSANGPGGMYRSTLILGGGLGAAFAGLCRIAMGDAGSENLKLFIPIGMAAMFSALIRLPLTGVLISIEVLESVESSFTLIVPMLAAAVVAHQTAAEMEDLGLYEQIIEQDNTMVGGSQVVVLGGANPNRRLCTRTAP